MPFGVPQGSLQGPGLCTIYLQPVTKVMEHRKLQYYQYTDDTQLYKALHANHLSLIIRTTQELIGDLKFWMSRNKLQLNESKTEFELFGKPSDLKDIETTVIEMKSDKIVSSKKTKKKKFGIVFDQTLSMTDQVSFLCTSLYLEIRRISQIRNYCHYYVTVTLMVSLAISKLRYSHALLSGLSLDQLQKI